MSGGDRDFRTALHAPLRACAREGSRSGLNASRVSRAPAGREGQTGIQGRRPSRASGIRIDHRACRQHTPSPAGREGSGSCPGHRRTHNSEVAGLVRSIGARRTRWGRAVGPVYLADIEASFARPPLPSSAESARSAASKRRRGRARWKPRAKPSSRGWRSTSGSTRPRTPGRAFSRGRSRSSGERPLRSKGSIQGLPRSASSSIKYLEGDLPARPNLRVGASRP